MEALIPVLGIIPVGFWLLAAVSALELATQHAGEGHTLIDYGFKGHLFFNSENFAPSGAAAHKRMGIGMAGFVLSAGGVAGLFAIFAV